MAEETGRAVAAATRGFFASQYAAGAPAGKLLLFSSFSVDALRAAQKEAPAIARGWLTDRIEDG